MAEVGEKRKLEESPAPAASSSSSSSKSQKTDGQVVVVEAKIQDAYRKVKAARTASFGELAGAVLRSLGYEADTCVWSVHFDGKAFSPDAVYSPMAAKEPEAGSVALKERLTAKMKGKKMLLLYDWAMQFQIDLELVDILDEAMPEGPRVEVVEKKGDAPEIEECAEDEYEIEEESESEEDEPSYAEGDDD